MKFGAKVLLIGAGPTGLILAQLMKVRPVSCLGFEQKCPVLTLFQLGGAGHVTLAANKGIKMDIARKIEAADSYIDLERSNAAAQWAQIKKENPCKGSLPMSVYDLLNGLRKTASTSLPSALVLRRSRTTRSTTSLEEALCSFTESTRESAMVHWPPNKIFLDEIK